MNAKDKWSKHFELEVLRTLEEEGGFTDRQVAYVGDRVRVAVFLAVQKIVEEDFPGYS